MKLIFYKREGDRLPRAFISRYEKYCHHEQPCWCGKPRDPKFNYEINNMGATTDEIGQAYEDGAYR